MKFENVTGIILAGGEGSRMGGVDKGLVSFLGKPMYQHVLERLEPQVATVIISANRHLADYQQSGYPVVSDSNKVYQGPVAGILAGLEMIETPFAVIVPCDAPKLSLNLVEQLMTKANFDDSPITLFQVAGRVQPLFGLFSGSLLQDLRDYYQAGERKLIRWCESHSPRIVNYQGPSEDFSNINTQEELKKLESS
ncbi:MAG: molybdenum cofactor guanylyltransferase [Pseudomonadales bacterium]|nr:molybdenum cofactor guanylyltransferase [Pseudomonadales bacterium]